MLKIDTSLFGEPVPIQHRILIPKYPLAKQLKETKDGKLSVKRKSIS